MAVLPSEDHTRVILPLLMPDLYVVLRCLIAVLNSLVNVLAVPACRPELSVNIRWTPCFFDSVLFNSPGLSWFIQRGSF